VQIYNDPQSVIMDSYHGQLSWTVIMDSYHGHHFLMNLINIDCFLVISLI